MEDEINNIREQFCSIRRTLGCYVCKKVINDPYKLDCGHSFCKTCIQKLEILRKNCPRCLIFIFFEGAFRKDPILENQIQHFKKMESAFQSDTQIDISKDLFVRSFDVDDDVQNRFGGHSADKNSKEIQILIEKFKKVEQANEPAVVKSKHITEGTTEIYEFNSSQKQRVRREPPSESELTTELYAGIKGLKKSD